MVAAAPLRIVFFGTPAFAVPTLRALIESRHPVVALISQPDRPKGRGHQVTATPTKELAVRSAIPVLQPTKLRDAAFLDQLAEFQPDLGVVAAYGRILPDALLALPRLGMINVHASLLPKYRGAAPVHRAVMAGDAATGVTIMRVVSELDAGPMLAIGTRAIGPDETSVDVERGLAELGAGLLIEVVDRLAAGPVVETPQDDRAATFAPKLLKTESPIDWSLDAATIHHRVRGLQPWPMASTAIEGARLLVHRTTVLAGHGDAPPGTVVEAAGGTLAVATGGGGVLGIVEIQPEGRRAMSVKDYLTGRRVPVGTLLGNV